ncbi:hypothetical protein BMI91_15175 [Thioclava sediminum]|uniref:Secreted protein n=1 Tax=Thioclava sediminum TaxID=1915319 RepID=A0ABX3MVR9_9RHOB|nr:MULTISPECIES: hypothetical protein [Thioclava]OOY23788.1 hypothetical protein BMI91_15175 [Thioclava sediminum]OOY30395.1 hypothetical protein BMI88_14500 [Thioclava sp. F36-6]
MKKLVFAFVAIAILAPYSSIAGPDATTQYLQRDVASTFDFGMLRLNLRLESNGLGSASYNWSENRIYIVPNLDTASSLLEKDEREIERVCSGWIQRVRGNAVIGVDGSPILGHSTYSWLFSHYGYERSNEPENLYSDLDKIFVLSCGGSSKAIYVTLTAPLLGSTYAVEKKPKE